MRRRCGTVRAGRTGPKKLRAVLVHRNPGTELPAVSTFAKICSRQGLVRPRRRSRRTPPSSTPLGAIATANALYSRYLIACATVRRPEALSLSVASNVRPPAAAD